MSGALLEHYFIQESESYHSPPTFLFSTCNNLNALKSTGSEAPMSEAKAIHSVTYEVILLNMK